MALFWFFFLIWLGFIAFALIMIIKDIEQTNMETAQRIKSNQVAQDIKFMKKILPDHYEVKELAVNKGHINCVSRIGIKKKDEREDDEHWEYIFKAIKNHFGNRFQEVYHVTCTFHLDFTVYVKDPNKIIKHT